MNDGIFGRKCPHDDWQCPNAHTLYSNPSIMVAFAQKKAGVFGGNKVTEETVINRLNAEISFKVTVTYGICKALYF